MACSLDTYAPPTNQTSNHRISFSNDFGEAQQQMARPKSEARPTPPSTDFEFSVGNISMISADELFFKGKLLPIKDLVVLNNKPTTLREELLLGDDNDDDDNNNMFSFGPEKGSSNRWKQILGLKKAHIGSKKLDKDDGLVFEHKAQVGRLQVS